MIKAKGIDGECTVNGNWVTITRKDKGEIDIRIDTICKICYEDATDKIHGYLQLGEDNYTIISFNQHQQNHFADVRSLIKRRQ
jgi:hypothetical protein